MIIVLEGPSAAGKSRHVRAFQPEKVVSEIPGHVKPDRAATVEEESRFWVARNEERWAQALDREARHAVAVCDTDPLKLHYAWTLVRAGVVPSAESFERQLHVTRAAIARRTLGIADQIACVVPSEAVLRERRAGDITRRRRNFETHLRLAGPIREWYSALGAVDPGRVIWDWPDGARPLSRRDRYDLDLFDAWMARLPST
ncbi:hypothetical protein [Streptomyces litchfieldiae]|uniref:Uncharacterized protein n=1 Tax=Streptomyces litchfieldiae TaxID=3075543 RepID=A0ABU2MW52_9ACTN|nr:hypothetical protein [Streptomyces sp. DSM 44938]MDT0345730.1 hypothetical protein [Streptomyces sp. DSM 44938]